MIMEVRREHGDQLMGDIAGQHERKKRKFEGDSPDEILTYEASGNVDKVVEEAMEEVDVSIECQI